jgi:hypothetical protein
METMQAETREIVSALIGALRALAASTSDLDAAKVATRYAELLELNPNTEKWVYEVRDALSNHKTDFTDSFDHSQSFSEAREAARKSAQAAVSHYVGLRRPELAIIIKAGRGA